MIDDIKVATKMQLKSITDDLAVDEMRAMIKNQACIDGCVFDPKNNLGLSSEDLVKAFFEMFKAKEIQPPCVYKCHSQGNADSKVNGTYKHKVLKGI